MAIKQRKYKNRLIHHSDRGLQYCSNDYQNVLNKEKMTPSMTEYYDPLVIGMVTLKPTPGYFYAHERRPHEKRSVKTRL
jgi:transposase InsO family protein